MILKKGDLFRQAWKGCEKPMWFYVLDLNREKNSLKVECHSPDGGSHVEDWDDLDITEGAFEIGEYQMMPLKRG